MSYAMTAATNLRAIKERRPLVHNITNFVVMNETANALLALGALPVMAHALEEVEEMAASAGALVLNIGTLWPDLVDSMIEAGKAANRGDVPVILDPVGAGATKLRTEASRRIMSDVDVAVVRGNPAEVAVLAGADAEIRGVESMASDVDVAEVARALAEKYDCVVAVTGAVDWIVGADCALQVQNGDPLLGTITGSGCMSTTICAAFCAVTSNHAEACAGALATFGVAGERAAEMAAGPGTFHVALYDALAGTTPQCLASLARIAEA